MPIKFDVTPERLREIFNYDPASGRFTYRLRVSQNTMPGDIAGSVNDQGYRHINVAGRAYKAHRLAWFWTTGSWPVGSIDHIDGDRDNNRIANLREASKSQNLANSRPHRKGRGLHKGVYPKRGRFIARIQKDCRSVFLGSFETEIAATQAYAAAALSLFGEFARTSNEV